MSLFQEQYHDQLLLSYLDIDSIARLSQVNRYYHNLTKDILEPFKTFFATKDTLTFNWKLNKKVITYKTCDFMKEPSLLFVQACIFGNLSVVRHIYKRFNIDTSDTISTTYNSETGVIFIIENICEYICVKNQYDNIINFMESCA